MKMGEPQEERFMKGQC